MKKNRTILTAFLAGALALAAPEPAEAKKLCKTFCGHAAKTGKVKPILLRKPSAFKPVSRNIAITKKATEIRVPQEARRVLAEIRKRRGAPPKDYAGQAKYKNEARPFTERLPTHDVTGPITYKEYDVLPKSKIKGVDRGKHRIVIGSNGRAYYTPNHYATFKEIK